MVKLATFDVLDKELTRDVDTFNLLDEDFRWNNAKIEFHLDPLYWSDYYIRIKPFIDRLYWKEFKYSVYPDLDKLIDSDHVGIYFFVIRPEQLFFGLPQFVLYVGISGEKNSMRPLKERLSDYFNIGNIKKRTLLHSMLKRYYQQTWIVYSIIEKITFDELENLEKYFHGFFVPPAAKRDFPVKIKNIIKAQFTR